METISTYLHTHALTVVLTVFQRKHHFRINSRYHRKKQGIWNWSLHTSISFTQLSHNFKEFHFFEKKRKVEVEVVLVVANVFAKVYFLGRYSFFFFFVLVLRALSPLREKTAAEQTSAKVYTLRVLLLPPTFVVREWPKGRLREGRSQSLRKKATKPEKLMWLFYSGNRNDNIWP